MALTKKQRMLRSEVMQLISGLNLSTDLPDIPVEWRTTYLESAKRRLIISEVLIQYVLMDEHLSDVMCREYFPTRTYPELWRTKRFKLFNYHILERMYLLQKLEFVRSRIRLRPSVYRDLKALNDVRNGLAHSFFPENRRVKPKWRDRDIFSTQGFEQFQADMYDASQFFLDRLSRRPDVRTRSP